MGSMGRICVDGFMPVEATNVHGNEWWEHLAVEHASSVPTYCREVEKGTLTSLCTEGEMCDYYIRFAPNALTHVHDPCTNRVQSLHAVMGGLQ